MIKLAQVASSTAVAEIIKFILNTVKEQNKTGAVLGMSGGVDSTVVAALAAKAFEGTNYTLIGYALPSNLNSDIDTRDAVAVARKLGITLHSYSIEDSVKVMCDQIQLCQFDKGNMISRIRANYLNTFAAVENKVLLGTGNKDEDFGVGYYALFGDGAVHCSPIGNLNKRHVFQLAEYLGFPEIAKKLPSAGLEPSQTSYGDLGYDYAFAEIVIEAYEREYKKQAPLYDNEVCYPSIFEVLEKPETVPELAEAAKPFLGLKFKTVREMVADVLERHGSARNKMQILHPPAARITKTWR